MSRRLVPLSFLALASVLSAQGLSLRELVVPVHATPDGEVWGVGPGYKVSFHDGVAFYPYLGAAREHLPLRWRTERVRVGDLDLAPGSGRA